MSLCVAVVINVIDAAIAWWCLEFQDQEHWCIHIFLVDQDHSSWSASSE